MAKSKRLDVTRWALVDDNDLDTFTCRADARAWRDEYARHCRICKVRITEIPAKKTARKK